MFVWVCVCVCVCVCIRVRVCVCVSVCVLHTASLSAKNIGYLCFTYFAIVYKLYISSSIWELPWPDGSHKPGSTSVGYSLVMSLYTCAVLSRAVCDDFATQGTTLTFAATCPVGQVRFNFHLPYSNFHLPLKNCMCYNISFKTKWFWHVKAYFLGQAWMADHETCTHSQK